MQKQIAEYMRKADKMAVWLNVEIIKIDKGYTKIRMKVREDMLNAVNICQGGAIFSFADFAFAVASNSYGKIALAMSANINFVNPARLGDILIAEATEVNRSNKIGIYQIMITREGDQRLIAMFSGSVFIKEENIKVV